MATPPVFTAGSVLTAAQMNAVGLWRNTACTVTSAGGTAATASNGVVTIGTNNTSVTINNAFNADFECYKVIINGGSASVNATIVMTLGASVTTYYSALNYITYAGVAGNVVVNNGAAWNGVGETTASFIVANFDIINPYLTKYTHINGAYPGTVAGVINGYHATNASYTSFTLSVAGGNMTGATIRVYGYNK